MTTEIDIQKENGTIINASTKQIMEIEDKCAICCDAYGEEDALMKTPCNHHFHKGCLIQWLWKQSTCPLCQKVVIRNRTFHWFGLVQPLLLDYLFYAWTFFIILSLLSGSMLTWALFQSTFMDEKTIDLHPFSSEPLMKIRSICSGSEVYCDHTVISFTEKDILMDLQKHCPSHTFQCILQQNRLTMYFLLLHLDSIMIIPCIAVISLFVLIVSMLALLITSIPTFLIMGDRWSLPFLWIAIFCVIADGILLKEMISLAQFVE